MAIRASIIFDNLSMPVYRLDVDQTPDAGQPPPEAQTAEERADASKAERRTALECPECFSHRAEVIHTRRGNKACCLDCDHIYPMRFRHVVLPEDADENQADREPKQKKGGKRDLTDIRQEITPAPDLEPRDIGTTTALLNDVLAKGPSGIRAAQRAAMRAAQAFQVEIETHWRRPTKFIESLQSATSDSRGRAQARFALAWRPKFLAALSLTRCVLLAARASHITRKTAYEHRKIDEEFAAQWQEAEADAIELLHARAFQRALEGDCEPIWYMGIRVGYVRKFDSRLQLEMLRAYRPDTFKTAGVQVNVGTRGDVFVLTEDQRHKLMDINREWLLDPSTIAKDDSGQVVTEQPEGLSNG
jgi:hypothetical protein